MKHRPTMLMILDGFGWRNNSHGNAISNANTPNFDRIFSKYPFITLEASGKAVGLPDGQIGNSEVGHLNIGAGNVILQDLPRINKSIEDGDFFNNEALKDAISHSAKGHALHIMGLISDGGVHSHINHLISLMDMAKINNVKEMYIHCFLDGRDVPPKSALPFVRRVEEHAKEISLGKIGIISGRFYAMDRDKRWDRLKLAYEALTESKGLKASTPLEAIENSYSRGETDEFVIPTIINQAPIKDDDSVIFINFRPDRAREITRALTDPNFDGFEREVFPKNLNFVCMTEYDASMPNVKLAYPPESVDITLGKVISLNGLRQLHIAETEKYAHVTFFFNGGVETPYRGEDRILVPSPKVATYDRRPEMSAPEVTEKVLAAISSDKYDLYILNFANPDMVGHTGDFDATVKAIEVLDGLVGEIVQSILEKDGQILLTADHGNADYMIDDKDEVVTKHSLSVVPLCHICNEPVNFKKNTGKLADISPTLLTLMDIPVPEEMKGNVLV